MEIIAAFVGGLVGGLAAYSVARWQRESDRQAGRRATVAAAVGDLGAIVAELRWEAARLAGVPDEDKYEESRKLAPLRGRMVAAHTRIYVASDDDELVHKSRAVIHVGLRLPELGVAQPFDPAAYEDIRSMLERTYRDLRQLARQSHGLGLLEGEPTSETTDDSEPDSDPVIW